MEQVQPPRSERCEEGADRVAEAAAVPEGLHHDRDAQRDRDEPEDGGSAAVCVSHAALGAAATITRQGAFLSTKSTVPPKIRPRRRWTSRRGAPITMISLLRRSASSTIARPARRARISRPTTCTPYASPIARAS